MSLRNSPDLRGGGGSGGCEGNSEGDLLGSKTGVCALLGILKCRGDDGPDAELVGKSAVRNVGRLPVAKFRGLLFGGELGGSTVTAGEDFSEEVIPVDDGLRRAVPGGEGVRLDIPLAPGRSRLARFLSAAEFMSAVTFCSCVCGLGETGRDRCTFTSVVDLAMCSKCERNEETGFWMTLH